MNLKGKAVLLTGAARVGQKVADMLARSGARVALTYVRDISEVKGAHALIEATGSRVECFQADLSRQEDVDRVVDDVVRAYGGIDILIHMAANYPRTPWSSLSEKDWDSTLSIIAKSAFMLGKRVGDAMLKNEGEEATADGVAVGRIKGKMIFFTDWSVLARPYAEYVPYNAAKSAVAGLTLSFAKELAPHITVNAIAPGPILPPVIDFSREELDEATAGTLLKRWGGADEIAKAVRYLLDADFVTGHILPVDGGRTIA